MSRAFGSLVKKTEKEAGKKGRLDVVALSVNEQQQQHQLGLRQTIFVGSKLSLRRLEGVWNFLFPPRTKILTLLHPSYCPEFHATKKQV